MIKKEKKEKKIRLDLETVNRGLADSREKAAAMIMAGDILVNGQVIYKADHPVTGSNVVEIKEKFPYASRGALKISEAFRVFDIQLVGIKALDIGISNGGFTDYMLQNGAVSVVGVDVNTRQVEQKVRNHPGVRLIETNARDLEPGQVQITPDIITIDVSFISILKILPVLAVYPDAQILSLVKPQFEARPGQVDKGGIVRDDNTRADVVVQLKERIEALGYGVLGFTPAGVKGRKGNREYFFLLQYGKNTAINDTIIRNGTKI